MYFARPPRVAVYVLVYAVEYSNDLKAVKVSYMWPDGIDYLYGSDWEVTQWWGNNFDRTGAS